MSKYLVFMENNFCLIGKEYFGDSEGIIIGYHNPRLATLFNTKEEAQNFCKTFDLEDVKIDRKEKHYKSFDKCNYVYRQINKIDNTHSRNFNSETPEEILEWWKKTKSLPEKSVKFEHYRTWPHLFSVFDHLWDLVSYNSRDYKEQYQTCQIKVLIDSSLESFKKELDLVLVYCTFFQDGYKVFPIIDHELSEYESRYFLYKDDSDCKITNGNYDKFSGTLEQCLNKMKQQYWYR